MTPAVLAARVALLEATFETIARTRMAGLPMLHPGLRVQAVGFQARGEVGIGVLVTPWFMNLVRLPLALEAGLAPGFKAEHGVGTRSFEFIGGHEAALGGFESASLFSPMFEFADQAAAVATAWAVLEQLRPDTPAAPARRGFLFGRTAARSAA